MGKKVKKGGSNLLVCWYNLGNGPEHMVVRDLDLAKNSGARVIMVCEHADRWKLTDKWVASNKGWAKFQGDGRAGGKKTCILYMKQLGLYSTKVTAKKSVTLVKARKVAPGAGPENAPPKVANRLRMRIDGKRIHFIAAHQYATVNKRTVAARKFLKSLTRVTHRRLGTVVGGIDANQPMNKPMMRAFRSTIDGWTDAGPTHDKRTIDYIWVRKGKITKDWVMDGSSDHRMVFANIQF